MEELLERLADNWMRKQPDIGDGYEGSWPIPDDALRTLLLDWLGAYADWLEDGERLTIEHATEPWDTPGNVMRLAITEDDLSATLNQFGDELTGNWEATYQSGHGRNWITYSHAMYDDIMDMIRKYRPDAPDGEDEDAYIDRTKEIVDLIQYEISDWLGRCPLDAINRAVVVKNLIAHHHEDEDEDEQEDAPQAAHDFTKEGF